MSLFAAEAHSDTPGPADDGEFVRFLAEHGAVPRRRVRRLLRSVHDADDVAQQAVTNLFAKWRRGAVEDLDPALLNRMSGDLAVDLLRSAERRHAVALGDDVPHPRGAATAADDPAELAARRDYLRRLLARLSDEDRLLVYLRVGLLSPFAELTGVFGASEMALRQRCKRAMRDLSEWAAQTPPYLWLPAALAASWRAVRRSARTLTGVPTVANAAAWGLFLATVVVTPAGTVNRRRPPEQERQRVVVTAGAGRRPAHPAVPRRSGPAKRARRAASPAKSAAAPLGAATSPVVGPLNVPKPHKPHVCVEGTTECQKRPPGHYVVVEVVPGRKVEVGQPYVPACDVLPQAPPYVTCSEQP